MKQVIWIVSVVLSIGTAYALAWWYQSNANPEIEFWREAYQLKVEHSRQLSEAGHAKLVFAGGSSVAFQISPEVLEEEFGIYSVNMGMHAATGAVSLIAVAVAECRPGDTLVLMMEPELMNQLDHVTHFGEQMSRIVFPEKIWESELFREKRSGYGWFTGIRPGLYHVATMLGKVATGRDLYRYGINDIQSGGMITTEIRNGPFKTGISNPGCISENSGSFLTNLEKLMQRKEVKLIYTVPWEYVNSRAAYEQQRHNKYFLSEIADFVPVLLESSAGVWTNSEDFADTNMHMTQDGAKERSRHFVKNFSKYK